MAAKKNVIRYVDETTAQVTKAFQKNAAIFGTEEFKLWRSYKAMFPDAVMTTKTIKRNPNKETYRNMTYKNMRTYIEIENADLLEEFEKQIKCSQIQSNPYRAVLAWFLQNFQEYNSYKQFFADLDTPVQRGKSAEPTTAPALDLVS